MKILKRYPDYDKCTPEYIVAISELLAACDYRTQCRLGDIITGISARCKFLPTVADFAEFVAEINPRSSTANRHDYRVVNEPRQPYRPYPKLWEAFAGELQLLDGKSFEALTEASLKLATEGREAARMILKNARDNDWKPKTFQPVPADMLKSSADLKTPEGPISDELRQKLIDEDWPYFAAQSPDRSAA